MRDTKNKADKRDIETEGTRSRMIDRKDKKHKKGMKGSRHGLDNYSNTTFTVLCVSSQTYYLDHA